MTEQVDFVREGKERTERKRNRERSGEVRKGKERTKRNGKWALKPNWKGNRHT